MAITVTALSITPIKGTRLRTVDAVELTELGARGDRGFYIVDDRGRMVNGKVIGALQAVVADHDEAAGELALTFPDGAEVRAPLVQGETVQTRFFSHTREARALTGPWHEALSAFAGRSLRIVQVPSAVDRGRRGAASLISSASVARLAQTGGREDIDARRFRMLIEIGGVGAHEEDTWVGRRVRVGAALLRMHGHVGRCLITSRDPDSGEIDLPTLDLLGEYRRDLESTEPLPFGIHGAVLEGGTVRVGDAVALADR
jgi:uncharacterized protein YcbX